MASTIVPTSERIAAGRRARRRFSPSSTRSPNARHLSASPARASADAREGTNVERKNSACLDAQRLRVSTAPVVGPSGVLEFGDVAVLHDQVPEPPVAHERRQKIAPPTRVPPEDHARAFIGRDRALVNHLRKHGVGMVHYIFEPR